MNGTDGDRWDDGHLVALLTGVRDGEGAGGVESPTSAPQGDRPAGISLEDVAAAGRAAFCFLDVLVTLRDVGRQQEPVPGASTAPGSGS